MNEQTATLVALPPSHITGFEVLELGMIDLCEDGRLMIGDPFRDFVKKGNPFIQLPRGKWPVMATIGAHDGPPVVQSVSIVFDKALLDLRRRWQGRVIGRGGPINLPEQILSPRLHDSDEVSQWECLTGHAAIVSKNDFEKGMPHPMPDIGWFEMLFESGKDDSWFDQVDRAQEDGNGIANIALPLNGRPVFIFPCAGMVRAWMERATIPSDGPEAHGELDAVEREVIVRTNPVVALHVQAIQAE